ncbi:MAG: tail fiber domain-containing protein [Vicinamibacterales bacterium]
MNRAPRLIWSLCALVLPTVAGAQPIGTFSWQLQPYCNRVTVAVTQNGGIYTADGYDDQCGAAQRAPLVGLATPNPDGTIGFGLNVVTVPGGRGVQIEARITLAGLSGSWSDSAGNSGTFAFGANTGGSPRPAPATGGSTIPNTFALLNDGGFLARGTAGVGVIPASGAGARMMWHPRKGAFRAGEVTFPGWDDVNIGSHSAAFGFNNVASGPYSLAGGVDSAAQGIATIAYGSNAGAVGNYSVAFGANTRANGALSAAFGQSTVASGTYSVAAGFNASATGVASQAFGQNTDADGAFSVAFGNASTASGNASMAVGTTAFASGESAIAIGLRATATGAGTVVLGSDATAATTGMFMFGDRSTTNDLTSAGQNEFLVRAAGGTIFYSNAAMTTGVLLSAGGGGWSNLSDANLKTGFRDLDGEHVLGKLAAMPVREWSYISQDAAIRHVGPTAQDFRAAFGLGESDVRIGSVDADGVALAAVKALEARTRATNERLTHENDELRARLARLESLLEKR